MKIKFWGVRGSIPCPGATTWKYGGNTPCIELRTKDPKRLIIIDAGSGIRELGNYLMAHDLPEGPIKADIFLTHTHWDHIMGLPFFTPIYIPGNQFTIYGPVTFEDETLKDIIGGQLTYRYFPIRQDELAAKIDYIDLKESIIDLGDGITVKSTYLNHPVLCLGYRFEHHGKIFCTAYDTEPFRNVFCTDPNDPSYDEGMAIEGEIVAAEENQRLFDFLSGADLLIHDAQYTQEEYESSRLGWGHSSFEHVISMARDINIRKLALFHHEPIRRDDEMDQLTEKYCTKQDKIEIFMAKEGIEIEI